MATRPSESVVVTADAQITPAGQAGYLLSYVGMSDTNHAKLNFEDGSGGTDKWHDEVVATTAEGDGPNMRHTFAGDGVYFANSIYLDLTDSPIVSVEFRRA